MPSWYSLISNVTAFTFIWFFTYDVEVWALPVSPSRWTTSALIPAALFLLHSLTDCHRVMELEWGHQWEVGERSIPELHTPDIWQPRREVVLYDCEDKQRNSIHVVEWRHRQRCAESGVTVKRHRVCMWGTFIYLDAYLLIVSYIYCVWPSEVAPISESRRCETERAFQ